MNICSAVIHARPENLDKVQVELEEFTGVEVHACAPEGKIIVTVEGNGDDALADTMMKFNDVDGVINTVMIYHYNGEEATSEEVIQ